MAATDPLRAEHAALMPRIEELRMLADTIDGKSVAELVPGVERAYDLVEHHITPHAMAEERVLYPAVERLMAAPGATATMTRDHVEISHLLMQLDAIRGALAEGGQLLAGRRRELRRLLYGLHTVIKLHLAKEEEIYAPLLDANLSEAEARQLFEDMHHVAVQMERSIEHFEPHVIA